MNNTHLTLIITITLLLTGITQAQSILSNPSFCCEKTVSGAFCVNAPEAQCAGGLFKKSPTSCETTSYCRLGTCYDSDEGICMENTPQSRCAESSGTWDPRPVSQVPQCSLGCCIIADQAAFVSLTRCKKLSTYYGVENNFNPTITDEISCIATAQAQDTGACVYEKDFERVCEFTTRKDCGAEEKVTTINETETSERRFYKDLLCSAEELGTTCARQTNTICYQGDAYWVDSCGNRENVYSTDKTKSWNNGRVLEADDVCKPGSGNTCGNCDYFLGSRCETWNGLLGVGKPAGASHVCQTTSCTDRDGKKRMNGESWCVTDDKTKVEKGLDEVGSRYFREVCVDGEVRVEPCADYRNEVCVQNSIETSAGAFSTAGCRVNRWQDCVLQKNKNSCENIDKRDCTWMKGVTGLTIGAGTPQGSGPNAGFSNPTTGTGRTTTTGTFSNPTATGNAIAPITGYATSDTTSTQGNRDDGVCVPRTSPGFTFWEKGGSNQCKAASAECVVVYETGILGGTKIVQGAECLEEAWALQANTICSALGDCGAGTNYVDDYTNHGYSWMEDGTKKKFSPNNENKIKAGTTISGKVIEELTGATTA